MSCTTRSSWTGRNARSCGPLRPAPRWSALPAYLPWAGEHWGNAWITFQPLTKQYSLEVVRGSHQGVQYDGTTFANPDDPTEPLFGDGSLPRLPDVEAERALDPDAYDVASWATEPGDVVVIHPRSLHSGPAVDAGCPDRHTLVLRFFGDDAVFRTLPDVEGHPLRPQRRPLRRGDGEAEPGGPVPLVRLPQARLKRTPP
ncbi:phytanoyl-CoA dioxygenase family protein [Kitasatospora sp. NPDC056531]|uniref:phytanoyl-CoA dioxygenase family protein n=1 Tax=Kitasatospora sp. NPDC056531 TaxID=3345856 RepID=UPI003683AE0C